MEDSLMKKLKVYRGNLTNTFYIVDYARGKYWDTLIKTSRPTMDEMLCALHASKLGTNCALDTLLTNMTFVVDIYYDEDKVTISRDYGECPNIGESIEAMNKRLSEQGYGSCPNPDVTAAGIMEEGLAAMLDRADERDNEGERSMKACVNAFNALYGTNLTETQGWMFMLFLKMSRANGGSFQRDDYVDLSAYAALAGECAAKESE